MTTKEYFARLEQAQKEMACHEEHCSGCCYLDEYRVCRLGESIYAGE